MLGQQFIAHYVPVINNNNNNNPICKAPECQKTSVALKGPESLNVTLIVLVPIFPNFFSGLCFVVVSDVPVPISVFVVSKDLV